MLGGIPSFPSSASAANCTDVDGTTATISADCTDLDIQGDNADVTINSGVTVSGSAVAVNSTGSGAIEAITNNGTINVTGKTAFGNDTTINTLTNTGTISASNHWGLKSGSSSAYIGTLNNSGTISTGNHNGLINQNSATINEFINSGTISASVNKGLINNSNATINTLTNTGTISARTQYGLRNDNESTITTLTNSGNIQANINGLYNKSSTITTLTNIGFIKALTGDFGLNNAGGTIGTLDNSGTISAGDDSSLWNGGTITTLTNSDTGTISAEDEFGLKNVNGTIGTLNNSGTISAGDRYGLFNDENSSNTSTITTLTNSGTISANRSGLWNDGTITTLTNSGNIKALTGDFGLKNVNGMIGTLNNSGTISAGDDYGLYNDGTSTITTLTNTGTISGIGNGIGIWNDSTSTITTLNNSQVNLTYKGKLPTNYNVIVNSATDYGKITFSSVSGSLNFGVHSTSTLAEGTYGSVISGLTSSNISSGTSGTYSNSNACSDVDAATVTFSSNCAELDISGDGSDITINSGVTISGVGDYDWTLNNSSGTTWDLVSTAQLDDAVNTGTNTSLNNLGTITAVASGANGILNQGTFTTLTNRGLITSDSAYGINNAGTITTLNNLQGASSSALTYDGKLPTNYNIIVNSASDFGKTTFSSVSGTTNFGVHSTSTLAEDTTYSSVLSGLSSSEIASGTSGTFLSGSDSYDWTLENSSGNLWDLVVATAQDITPDTNTSVTTSVKPNVVLGINSLNAVTEVNFANMNTYDCDLFGEDDVCMSLGGRYTAINTPETQTNSFVLVGGYKLSDTLRVAGFFHRNLNHNTPASFKLSDRTPMVGALVVWNQKPNKLGYQLKLANAFQRKNAYLTREVVGASEEGKGQTTIEAKSYVAELLYSYQINNDTVLSPYLAARWALIKQDAYTETGASSPLSFNKIEDESITLLLGLKFNTALSHNLSLKGSLGVEHDINHSVDKLEPTGISGLTTVSLDNSFNRTRPVVSAGFDYELKPNHRISSIFQYQELPYQSKTESNAYINYTIGF